MNRYLLCRAFSSSGKRVGFIGLGNMGMPMSGNLKKNGFEVKAFDISAANLEKAAELGVTPVQTVAEVSKGVDFIVTSVPNTRDVQDLLNNPEGIFANADKGTFIVDTSTISPLASKEFAAAAKKQEMVFIDSPMSGGIGGAQNGTLTFMVGCEKEHYDKVKEMLVGMGKNVFHCGGPGTGEIAKICNNLILGISMVAASEGLSLGEKLGMDPKVLSQILSVSTARNWCIDTYNPRPGVMENVPASRDYNGGFQVSLIRKDLSIALESAESAKSKLKFGEMCIDYYLELEKKGFGKKDFGFVYQYIHKNYNL